MPSETFKAPVHVQLIAVRFKKSIKPAFNLYSHGYLAYFVISQQSKSMLLPCPIKLEKDQYREH